MELKTQTLQLRENKQIVRKVMGTFTRNSASPEPLLALAKVLRVSKHVHELQFKAFLIYVV